MCLNCTENSDQNRTEVLDIGIISYLVLVQGVPFEKSQKEMAVELKRCIFDQVLVKPKCV